MKKVKWLFFINAGGVTPFGYGGIPTGAFIRGYTMKFQAQLKAALQPEIDLEFIGYDTTNPETPCADLILYNETDAGYIDEETKAHALGLPYKSFYTNDIETIKARIESEVLKTE